LLLKAETRYFIKGTVHVGEVALLDALMHPALPVAASAGQPVDLAWLAARLESFGTVTANPWMVRAEVEQGIQLSVFADGRAIVSGTREESKARAIVARYVGA